MLAWTHDHQGEMASAQEEADIAVGLNPNDPFTQMTKGRVLVISGQAAAAHEPLTTALRLDPSGPTAPAALHHLGLGYYFEQDYVSAEATTRRAIWTFPDFPRPRPVLAAALGQLGRATKPASHWMRPLLHPRRISGPSRAAEWHTIAQRTTTTCLTACARQVGRRWQTAEAGRFDWACQDADALSGRGQNSVTCRLARQRRAPRIRLIAAEIAIKPHRFRHRHGRLAAHPNWSNRIWCNGTQASLYHHPMQHMRSSIQNQCH